MKTISFGEDVTGWGEKTLELTVRCDTVVNDHPDNRRFRQALESEMENLLETLINEHIDEIYRQAGQLVPW